MTKQERKSIATSNAPGAIGPYSQAVQFGNMMITSGQLGMNAAGEFPDSVSEQAKQSLTNVKAILEAADYAMEHVVKTTVFLKDMNDFQTVNEVYATFFAEPYPARSAVEVAKLPKDGLVEIEVIAVK
ncbi:MULTISPECIES: RidA family protein [unclassified Paenibacillus]|uniref:RidA family protein n=1 Tax=unclassified Paenibacillus TaxID=185978 RepID=UPI0009A87DD3|nr:MULTISPECIES: RidA family protein [unclassified Paenibacillus]SLK04460.1 2-iminobutanoate/2-iminopropanoate deaminase [Paenibacillus sp. RU5A]SOC69734.1 2-iminobutanoate/2-iminopropanoate deaminase [Paenibacillus sp. RU26A]SOC72098.1 2-iminobutanoate/2-iminopropanoate deaminase [Paenibacillus sp. RU5M]